VIAVDAKISTSLNVAYFINPCRLFSSAAISFTVMLQLTRLQLTQSVAHGWSHWNFIKIVGYTMRHCGRDDMFIHFDKHRLVTDTNTDKQTQGHSICRASIASCGKNRKQILGGVSEWVISEPHIIRHLMPWRCTKIFINKAKIARNMKRKM